MRKFVFTKELLEDYYKNRFVEDLNSLFIIENIDNAEYVKEFKTDLHYAINPPILPTLFSIMHRSTNSVTSSQEETILMNDRREDEEEVLFAALISFMFVSENTIYRLTGGKNEKEVAFCLSAFGFPWLYPVTRMGLSDFLSEFRNQQFEGRKQTLFLLCIWFLHQGLFRSICILFFLDFYVSINILVHF